MIYVIVAEGHNSGEEYQRAEGVVVGDEADAQAVVDRLCADVSHLNDKHSYHTYHWDAVGILSLAPDGSIVETYQEPDPA